MLANTTSILQPFNQSIISQLKHLYIKVLSEMTLNIKDKDATAVQDSWKGYDVHRAITHDMGSNFLIKPE